jgi:hypothetical protein
VASERSASSIATINEKTSFANGLKPRLLICAVKGLVTSNIAQVSLPEAIAPVSIMMRLLQISMARLVAYGSLLGSLQMPDRGF